jgi:hypothetical protein
MTSICHRKGRLVSWFNVEKADSQVNCSDH